VRDFNPAYVADGSFTSFPPSRYVRFAPRVDIRPRPRAFAVLRLITSTPRHRAEGTQHLIGRTGERPTVN
jgi:hypothetical protein